jgi:hypothetical protein
MPADHSRKAWRGDRRCCLGVAARAQNGVCGWASPALIPHPEPQSCAQRQPAGRGGRRWPSYAALLRRMTWADDLCPPLDARGFDAMRMANNPNGQVKSRRGTQSARTSALRRMTWADDLWPPLDSRGFDAMRMANNPNGQVKSRRGTQSARTSALPGVPSMLDS